MFRDKFYRALRSHKAKGGNWTKSFTWKQVMDIFDTEWAGGDYYKACEAHGPCVQCELEELQDRIQGMNNIGEELKAELAHAMKDGLADIRRELKEALENAARGSVRGDARRGNEGGDSKA